MRRRHCDHCGGPRSPHSTSDFCPDCLEYALEEEPAVIGQWTAFFLAGLICWAVFT
jgi:hypothetical protein